MILGGAELFTGNTLMVMAWAARKVSLREMLRAWVIVYAGNFVGAVGTALLVYLSGQYLDGKGRRCDRRAPDRAAKSDVAL